MSNMDFNTSILHVKTLNDGTKLLVDSSGKNAWGSTAQESVDGAIADFVAEGGEAKDIVSIETVDLRDQGELKMECTYTYKFVVDEFGRPGGMYSLADLPITGYKVLERTGTIISQDSKNQLFEIKDTGKDPGGFTIVIPMKDVKITDKRDI